MTPTDIITPPTEYKPRIVCAALRNDAGQVIIGPRHFDFIMRYRIAETGLPSGIWMKAEQGFIDQRGKFYDRKEAYKIALANGQIINKLPGAASGILFSEHLY